MTKYSTKQMKILKRENIEKMVIEIFRNINYKKIYFLETTVLDVMKYNEFINLSE